MAPPQIDSFCNFFYIFLRIETGIETTLKIGNLWITLWITLDNFCLCGQVVKGCRGRVKGLRPFFLYAALL